MCKLLEVEVLRLEPKPGELLIFRVDTGMQADEISRALGRALSDVSWIILHKSVDVSVGEVDSA